MTDETDTDDQRVKPIPSTVFNQIAIALYGRDWVTQMAEDLGVARRTVMRWKFGDTRITPRIADDLHRLIAARIVQLNAAAGALERVTVPPPQ